MHAAHLRSPFPGGGRASSGIPADRHDPCVGTIVPDSLLIGLSALQAQKRAMEVSSHNLANAATEGFSRQRAEMVAPTPETVRPGQLGRGVDVSAIRRIVDQLTDERLRASASEASRLKTMRDNLKTVELVFNEPGENGLAGVTNRLFNVLSDLSNNPESSALRSAAVQELETWTSTVNDLATRLDRLRQDIRDSIDDELRSVNAISAQIADLNQQIRRQTLVGNQPNDLMDARDRLIEELSGHLELRVLRDGDNGVRIDAGGIQLVGMDSANALRADVSGDGGIRILTPNGGILRPSGGSLAALDELDAEIVPGITSQLDELVGAMVRRLNGLHATSTSQAASATAFQASFTVPQAGLYLNLDDPELAMAEGSTVGIPASFAASFTDAAGNATARNLTINIRDTATGEARKYVLRYDPAVGNGSRSLSDLVTAINSGSGGGFTVLGGEGIGVSGLSAKAVAVEGGWQLQLATTSGSTVDFSPALDLQPTRRLWAGPSVSVSANVPIPAAVGSRLQFAVEPITPGSSILQLRVSSRDPADGRLVSYGTVALGAGPTTVSIPGIGGSGELSVTVDAGTYRAGDVFSVALDSVGQVVQQGATPGVHQQDNQVAAGDAGVSIRGRYTGALGLEPSGTAHTTWAMSVVTGGTIGAKSGGTGPQPPVVEFAYWTGTPGAAVRQTKLVTLDDRLPAGTPVQIADGVYAVFGAGSLTATTTGNEADFIVDARPDEAGLLPSLGIAGMFTGSTAADLRVAQRLIDDPNQLNTGLTRSEGDNGNVLRMMAARSEKLYGGGSFAFDDTYNATLSEVGVRIRQSERLSENQASIQAALKNQRQQVSGVNIDEEIGLMILQQQAYTAAARVVTFARENIQTLLDLAR